MRVPVIGTFLVLLFNGLIAGVPAVSPAQPQAFGSSQFALFPIFDSDPGEFIGLALTNTSAALNSVGITWTNSDGTSTRTGQMTLAPGAQRVALVREFLGIPDDPTEGWFRIESSVLGLMSYMTTGRDELLDAAEPASMTSGTIFLPHIAVDTGFLELASTDTRISLVNPGSAAAQAQAELIGLDGSVAGNLVITLPPQATRTFRVSESFRDALPPNQAGGKTFRGYMKVSSGSGLAGWLQIETPLSRCLLRGSGIEELVHERQALASQFAFGSSALYRSELNLVNVGSTSVMLDILAEDDSGRNIGQTVRRTLGPGQAMREDVLSLFKVVIPMVYPPPPISGYIRIRSVDGTNVPVMGDIRITSGTETAAMLSPIGAPVSSTAILPYVISDSVYFTGYAIANPNELLTVQNDITVELFDREGNLVGTPARISLSPAARYAGLIKEKVPGGYLRIRANGPFAVLGSIGSWSSTVLTPIWVVGN